MASTGELTLIDAVTYDSVGTTFTSAFRVEETDIDNVGWMFADYVSGTTTTADVTIQHSHDNVNYLDVAAFTQVTTTDSAQYKALLSSTIPSLLRYVRAKVVIAGTSPNYILTVKILFSRSKV